MNKKLVFSVLTSIAMGVSAQNIATIDMELVISAHPQSATNRVELLQLQKTYMSEQTNAREKMNLLYQQGRTAVATMNNEALSESSRRKAAEEVRDIQEKLATAEEDYRKLTADRQSKLRAREMELFEATMKDIKSALDAYAKKKGFDIVLDKSADRASAPIPFVMYSIDSMDITDDLITLLGGDKAAALELRANSGRYVFGADDVE